LLRGFVPPTDARTAYLWLFTQTLNNWRVRLIEAGRLDEAAAAAHETVQVARQAAVAPGADVMSIASLLVTLSEQLAGVPLRPEAVEAAQAAADLLRGFVPPTDARTAHLWLFTQALNNSTVRLIEAGRLDEAATAANETIQVARQAAAAPSADVTSIVSMLMTLSLRLATVPLRPEAVAVELAAAELLREDGVLTQHNDNHRTGAYLHETVLTPNNVTPNSFGLLYSLDVGTHDQLAAQPLFVPSVFIPTETGNLKDVLYVATRTNFVYAFDVGNALLAPQQRELWKIELRDVRGLGADDLPGMGKRFPGDTRGPCGLTLGPVGIDSTPVIDPASHAMWVVYRTASPFAMHRYDAQFYIVKIDIRTGKRLAEQPIVVNDSQFDANKVLPRTGLLLDHGVIYLGFGGAVCDDGGGDPNSATQPHGWVIAIDSDKLTLLAKLNTTPQSNLGGVWQSGYGLAADDKGFIYAFTGNNENLKNGLLRDELSEAVLKLGLNRATHAFAVEHFSMPNWQRLDKGDTDLASGGPLVLPNGWVAGGGKEGRVYVFDPNEMQKQKQDFQAFYNSWRLGISPCDYDLNQVNGPNIHGIPVLWHPANTNYSLFYGMPEKDYLKAHTVDDSGHFNERPVVSTLDSGIRSARGMPGGFLSLSANGGRSGIIWVSAASQTSGDALNTRGQFLGRLMAFDALTLQKLWESTDQVAFAKYIPPTIAAGKAFWVGYEGKVLVYGLSTPQASIPNPPVRPAIRPVTALWREPIPPPYSFRPVHDQP
jgi:hypothetical protein